MGSNTNDIMLLPLFVLTLLLGGCVPASSTPTPVVLWHGMGDSCCNPASMGSIKRMLEDELPGVYVHSLKIGDNILSDTESGFFKDTNAQVELVCKTVREDPQLQEGFNAIGFSQGGQFLRAVAQRCPNPPMRNLITVGAQHRGVFGFPKCPGEIDMFCDIVRDLLNFGVYTDLVQNFLVQAQYWHDPLHEDTYLDKSRFIADINNERTDKNATYKENLVKLENLVMIKHSQDSMVEPKESEHFEFYTPGQAKTIQPLRDSALYTEDWLGLRALDETGRLHMHTVEGDHLHFSRQWFIDEIVNVYLNN